MQEAESAARFVLVWSEELEPCIVCMWGCAPCCALHQLPNSCKEQHSNWFERERE